MICIQCSSTNGEQYDVETFQCTDDGDWVYSGYWQCFDCGNTVDSWEDGFEYKDEE